MAYTNLFLPVTSLIVSGGGEVESLPGLARKKYTPYVAHFKISLWRAVDAIYVYAY